MKIKIFFKHVKHVVVITFLGLFLFMGSWCLPPTMVKRIIDDLKAKYSTELIQEEIDKTNFQ